MSGHDQDSAELRDAYIIEQTATAVAAIANLRRAASCSTAEVFDHLAQEIARERDA